MFRPEPLAENIATRQEPWGSAPMPTADDMLKRQRVLADFGEYALRSENLDEVLTKACQLVSGVLGTDLSKILEIERSSTAEDMLFVRAGVGWQPDVVHQIRLPISERSSESYAIEAGEPVSTADIGEEERFVFPAFMKEAGVVGMVNVPIFLPGHRAYGLLQVDSRKRWKPNEHDIQFLRTYATILGPVIDRLHKIHALEAAERKNETLLRELQHRIKNKIAAIMGLIALRRARVESAEVRAELGIVGERIETLRLVHEQVYATGPTDRLALRPYVSNLLEGLLELHREVPVRLDLRVGDVEIASDCAIPLGLILNEFTTNSLKYAFTGNGESCITAEAQARGKGLWFRISDNGKGLPTKPGLVRPGFGTGMAMIDGLVE